MSNYNIKTTPNQKVVIVNKEKCSKDNIYATINLNAMEQAAQNLDAGAFKLWVYFAKNQNGYKFALSSKDAASTFGLKKKQYDNAVKDLKEKGYLVAEENSNVYTFNEIPISVVSKGNNAVVSKGNNALYPKDTRNITDITLYNTINNTNDNTGVFPLREKPKPEEKEKIEWVVMSKEELLDICGNPQTLVTLTPSSSGAIRYKFHDTFIELSPFG